MLPEKRKPVKSGILRAPCREWPTHRSFVRRHTCVVTLGKIHDECDGPIEVAHVRLGAPDNGIGIKPHDAFTVSLCHRHHMEAHAIGESTFQQKYGLDLLKIAAEFTRLSTDLKMKESLRECPNA